MSYGTPNPTGREVILIIHYFHPVYSDDLVLSIDNIVLDFYNMRPAVTDQLVFLIDNLAVQYGVEIIRWTSFKPGTFSEQTSIRLSDDISFWVGVGLNGKKTAWDRCRVEFNPNKVGNTLAFARVLKYLCDRTFATQRKVARFDLAIDVPVSREQCFLVKDRRLYLERRHGQEYTQYLGAKSSKVGRVKLYNKAIESSLDYPLTRLELTLDPAVPFENVNWPSVYYLDAPNILFDKVRVTETERFIIRAILNGFGSLHDLGRKTQAKIRNILNTYILSVTISTELYSAILTHVAEYESGAIFDETKEMS